MRMIYSSILRLYPAEYRQQFSEEMLGVFTELRAEYDKKSSLSRSVFFIREVAGLTAGALNERLRILFGSGPCLSFPRRSFTMRNGFRFPKTTAILMTIILAGVVTAIKKGEDIAGSLPHDGGLVGPIHSVHSTLLSPIPLILVSFYAIGLAGWAILFALRRSGVHRLADMSGQSK